MKKIKKEYYFITILLICFMLLTLLVISGKLNFLDELFFKKVINLKNGFLTTFLYIITNLGSTIGTIILLLLTFFIFLRRKAISDFKYVIINVATGTVLMQVLKSLIRRIRPSWKWIVQGGFSYPSGHTITALLFYGTLMLLVHKKVKGRLRKPLLVGFSLVIFFIAFSRIYFGAHYFSDVLASIILGITILIISNIFMNKEFNNDKNRIN